EVHIMAKAKAHTATQNNTQNTIANLPMTLSQANSNKHGDHARNTGIDLQMDWIDTLQVNMSAVERRTSTLLGRRSVKKNHQAAWLLKALSCIDLTTLSGDDTAGRVKRLCAKARKPLSDEIITAL